MNITYKNAMTAEQFNNLRVSVAWSPVEPALAQKGLEHTAFLTVACDNEKPVGMARVITDYGYQVLIADVIVHPDYQGKGIGTDMMKQVMAYINDSVAPGQGKAVTLNAAKGKESFYKRFGFFERPTDKFGAGMTQWISKEET